MNNLINDIIINMIHELLLLIIDKLSNRDKVTFLHTGKTNNSYKDKIYFNDQVSCNNIQKSPYFDNFTNVVLSSNTDLPKNIKKISIESFSYVSPTIIPLTVTHLNTFSRVISEKTFIYNLVPLTHFCIYFNNISYMQNTITHLYINYWVTNEYQMPNSVIYLYINYCQCANIEKYIASSVKHLHISDSYISKNTIPSHITKVTISEFYVLPRGIGKRSCIDIGSYIPETVKTLYLPFTYNETLPTHCKIIKQ